MCSLASSQNEGLSEYQGRASRLCTGPSPHHQRQRDRVATARAGSQGAILAPGASILHETVSRVPVVNHIFLGSWMVDICREGHSLKSAPQRRHMAHLRWCFHSASGKLSSWTREVIKMHCPPGTVHSPSTRSPELLRTGKSTGCTPN